MAREMKISCERCRLRKIKCTRTYPCSACTLVGQECKFREDDSKRRPVGRNYVVALEGQIALYETLIRKAKAASAEERTALLDSISFDDHFPPVQQNNGDCEPCINTTGSSRMSTTSLQPSPQGPLLFHGPTSMYQTDISPNKLHSTRDIDPYISLREWQSLRMPQNLRIEDEIISKVLSSFFLYQYPQYMLIHRDAFLEDYYENLHQGNYWSYPLLYAICALGVQIFSDARMREKGDILAHCAETIIMSQTLGLPHITIAQSLLCLAFYQLGAGDNSKGWLFAGMAFRMGQDLGLQQDPKFVVSRDSKRATEQDLEIRRHVYYGFYISDKIICLHLGRPIMLYEAEAAVDFPQVSIDFQEAYDRFGLDEGTESDLDHTASATLVAAFEVLIELSKLIEEVLFKVFSTKMVKKPRPDLVLYRSSRLEELSVSLSRWHTSLPVHLAWNQWNPTRGRLTPLVLIINLLYHSTLIALNRHFIRPTPGFAEKTSSKEICISSVDCIIALIRLFRAQDGLGCAPILAVYSVVVAGNSLLFTQNSGELSSETTQRLSFILKALDEFSETYGFAREARTKLQANIDIRRSFAAEHPVSGLSTAWGIENDPGLMGTSSMSWTEGSMFDFSAFDLSGSGTFNSMTLDCIGVDSSQGLPTFAPSTLPTQALIFNEEAMNLQSAQAQSNHDSVPDFGSVPCSERELPEPSLEFSMAPS